MRIRLCVVAAMVGGLAAGWSALPAAGQEFNMPGTQVWNCDYWQTVSVGDFMGPNYEYKKLKPIALAGARNGTYSGYVVMTNSNGPIRGLKAHATDLVTAEGAKIAAGQVRIRYPELAHPSKSYAPPYRFDGLLDAPPEVVETIYFKEPVRNWKPKNDGPVATQPIWVTLKIPKDAAPGDYDGKLIIEGEDLSLSPMEVAIKATVYDWQMPDSKDFVIQNLGWLLPEREALYYDVPMWSDKHMELMAKSLPLMLDLGSRQVQVNLTVHYPSQDNAETLVKWIKQPDGSFKYDFSAFDNYMEVVARTIGKPLPVRLNMWCYKQQDPPYYPRVLMVDPSTGKTTEMDQPLVGTPESLVFWKPVLDEIRVRMDKRGWFGVTGANWHQYCGGPTPAAVSVLKRIWPDGKWTDMDHGRRWPVFAGIAPSDAMPILTTTTVWNEGDCRPRGYKKGLLPGVAICGHARDRHREWSALWEVRGITEEQIMKGNHGVDPLGGDLWPLKNARGGYSYGLWAACALGPGNCTKAFLAPGPNGAIATERYESFREGVEIAEAILFIQRSLDAGKLDAKVAERANRVLDDRSNRMLDSWPKIDTYGHRRLDSKLFAKDAQQRESELYATAAEVSKALGLSGSATTKPQ